VVQYICEIPLPGRALTQSVRGHANGAAEPVLPTFVAGPENRLVASTVGCLLEAARTPRESVAGSRGTHKGIPPILALFGPSGSGKTHLAHGLVRRWQDCRGADSALYTTATDFRRRFTDSVDNREIVEFRREFRGRQLLAIDGLQHLPSGGSLWQELRYAFDEYQEDGGIVVVTSDRPTHLLANMPPDIRSRIASGLVLELSPPGSAARVEIIRQLSTSLGKPLGEEDAKRLSLGLNGTANDLFGAVFRLLPVNGTNGVGRTHRVDAVLADRVARRPALREIIAVVTKNLGVPQKQLKSSSRRQSVVFARAAVAYLARELSDTSYDEIGRALGGRDHTTIIHSYRKIESDQQHDATIRETLAELRNSLANR
jgi:chromosomal replication initiator protein